MRGDELKSFYSAILSGIEGLLLVWMLVASFFSQHMLVIAPLIWGCAGVATHTLSPDGRGNDWRLLLGLLAALMAIGVFLWPMHSPQMVWVVIDWCLLAVLIVVAMATAACTFLGQWGQCLVPAHASHRGSSSLHTPETARTAIGACAWDSAVVATHAHH